MEEAKGEEFPGEMASNARIQTSPVVWALLLVLVALVWGTSFIAVKYILRFVSPLDLIALRFVPAGLIFAVLLLPGHAKQVRRMLRADGWRFVLLGLTGAIVNNTFLGWGLEQVAAGTASLIIAMNPVFTYAFSMLTLGERFLWWRAVGMVIAFAGVFVIIRWGSGRAVTLDEAKYALMILVAPFCFAIYTVLGKSLIERYPPLLVVGTTMMVAGAISLAFVRPSLLNGLPALPLPFWGAILFMVLLGTVFAFAVWSGALQRMPAGRVASFNYLIPLFAVMFGHWVLDEPITAVLIVGAALLIGGVWLVNRR